MGNDYKNATESTRATVPIYDSRSTYCNSVMTCTSAKISDACQYVHLTSLINPSTITEKFHFLRLFLQNGKDFKIIAKQLTYKTVHHCVRFYYLQKLQFGLSALLERVQSGEVVSYEELMALARNGVLTYDS